MVGVKESIRPSTGTLGIGGDQVTSDAGDDGPRGGSRTAQKAAEQRALQASETGDETALTLAIARRYYQEDQSKIFIGQSLGISRFQVARLLREARQTGLVRIEIGSPGRVDEDLSTELAEHLRLERAVVVQADPTSEQATFDYIGEAVASELQRLVQEGGRLGLCWSRALPSMARNLRRIPPCTVVQLSGAVYPPEGLPGSVEVVRAVADVAHGTAYPLYAPLIVPDVETADGLRRLPGIAATLALTDRIDVAVMAVGAWTLTTSNAYALVTRTELQHLAELGVCGEVAGRLLNTDGQPVTLLDARTIGASLENLCAAPSRILSSQGVQRRDATLAAIKTGLATILVVDDNLARSLLV